MRNIVPRYRVALVRESQIELSSYPRFSNSASVFEKFRAEFAAADREHFCIVTVDSKNRLIGFHTISVGTLSSSLAAGREVFKPALLDSSAAIILIHNHISGDPAPSREDRECTQRLVRAGKVLGIRVLDHIICGESEHFSFADAGCLDLEGSSEY
jgi:DNA repair protein RadC